MPTEEEKEQMNRDAQRLGIVLRQMTVLNAFQNEWSKDVEIKALLHVLGVTLADLSDAQARSDWTDVVLTQLPKLVEDYRQKHDLADAPIQGHS
jgi:hypothetical protein